ncbi:MAG: hypothetical protein PHE02_05970 [Lachnospiraceae bacterium]|nr:hypothetical protein [Lachnospiraceae bacterium]
MRNKLFIIGAIFIVIIGIEVLGYNTINRTEHVVVADDCTLTLEANIKEFNTFGSDNFTCTGLTWDASDNSFWIGDYGALNFGDMLVPRVVEIDKDLRKVLKVLEVSDVLSDGDNLQGVAYDQNNNSLWLAVGDSCKNINKDGKLIYEFNLGKYSSYKANGICVDNDTLWVLCYSKYLLHYDKTGNLIKEFNFNYKGQDQICIYEDTILATIGADYTGENNYVVSIAKETDASMSVKYQVKGAYAVEGIAVVDGKLYIVNDGLYHDAKIKESYISIFDINTP